MKKYSQHQKPEDGESRKLNQPVICYPNDKIIINHWENYQLARKDLEKIGEVIIPPRDAKCLLVINKGKKIPRNDLCPATNKKFKNCCGAL